MNLLTELLAARARMAEREHVQGDLYLLQNGDRTNLDQDNPDAIVGCCLMGAFLNGRDLVDEPVFHEMFGLIRALTGTIGIKWNDVPGRTKADVIALLDKAIAQARSAP